MQAVLIGCALVLSACLVAGAGCAKKADHHGTDHATAKKEAPPSATDAGAPAATDAGSPAATGEVQLAGTLGCGHCAYHVTNECAVAVKTAAGDMYVIDGVPESSDLWAKRLETNQQIALTGTVLGNPDDKVKHVAMTSFELR